MSEKLQKVLARAGIGSRREMERWIEQGRITVDGQAASIGARVTEGQQIRVDGRPLTAQRTQPARRRVIAYHKPEGEVCTRKDPEGRPTVFDGLPRIKHGRWVAVGRLDINTSGLLLFTNDGELANRLMHPRHEIKREYAVRVLGQVSQETLARLRSGVMLDDGPAQFDKIRDAGGSGRNHWYHVTLHEGRNREVRRMWEAVGAQVSRLIRIRFGELALPRALRAGRSMELGEKDVNRFATLAGLGRATPSRPGANRRRHGRAAATRKSRRA